MRRVLAGLGLAGMLCSAAGPAQAAWPEQYADVETWPAWGVYGERLDEETYAAYGGDLTEAVWFELMVGDPPVGHPTAPRTFRPYDTITRAEFATVLARALGIDRQTGLGPDWFWPTVQALQEAGIITTGGNYREPITRREMGDWVGRALEWYGVDLAGKPELHFSDLSGLPEAPYIRLATQADVIKGYPDGTYGPERTATRAEAAVMALRLAKQLKKDPPGPEVFEQHFRDYWAVVTEIEREVAEGKPYNHSYLLEPYMSDMMLYGHGGYDVETRFFYSFRPLQDYLELVDLTVRPIMMRDTIAVVEITRTTRTVGLDGDEIGSGSSSAYYYFAKRNGRWIGTNTNVERSLNGYPPVGGTPE